MTTIPTVTPPTVTTAADAARMPNAPGRLSALVLNSPGLEVRWYAPPNPDPQGPHDRDEVYVVMTGTGEFEREGKRTKFGPGDLIFVAKGEQHRFVDHTKDTAMWVVFGPGA